MNAQEIKDGMTKGIWIVEECGDKTRNSINNPEIDVWGFNGVNCEANAAAITTAVNGTYNAGIDPTKVKSIFEQSQLLLDEMLNSGTFIDRRADLQYLLNEAKLK